MEGLGDPSIQGQASSPASIGVAEIGVVGHPQAQIKMPSRFELLGVRKQEVLQESIRLGLRREAREASVLTEIAESDGPRGTDQVGKRKSPAFVHASEVSLVG